MFTVTFVLYEKDGLFRTEALRYWRDTHGPLVSQVPGVQRYVQQHAVGAPDGTPPFLGVASLGFADSEAFGAATASRLSPPRSLTWRTSLTPRGCRPPSSSTSSSSADRIRWSTTCRRSRTAAPEEGR